MQQFLNQPLCENKFILNSLNFEFDLDVHFRILSETSEEILTGTLTRNHFLRFG